MARKKKKLSAKKLAIKKAKKNPNNGGRNGGHQDGPVQPSQTVAQETGAHQEDTSITEKTDAATAVARVDAVRSFFAPWLQNVFFWFLALIVATTALAGPYGQSGGYTPDLHMAAYIQVTTFLLLTLLALASIRITEDHFDIIRSPIVVPAALFYVYAMLSFFWATTKYDAVIDMLDWTGACAAGFAVLLLIRNYSSIYWFIFAMFISGVLIALLGIGQYLFGIDWVQQHITPGTTFSNKNMSGQYGVLTAPLGIILFFQAKRSPMIWMAAIGSACIISLIYYTRARGSWLAFLVELVLIVAACSYIRWGKGLALLLGWEKKIALLVALLLTFILFSLTPGIINAPGKILDSYSGEEQQHSLLEQSGLNAAKHVYHGMNYSASKRITIWLNSIPMIIDHFFFGAGIGNWRVLYPTYQEWFWPDWELHRNLYHANAHNDYVEIISEFGLFGSILFFWLIFAFFRTWIYVARRSTGRNFIILGPVIAIFGIGTSAVFSFPLKQPVPILFVMVYLGLISCYYSFLQPASAKAYFKVPYKNMIVRPLMAAFFLIATTFLFIYNYNLYISELNYRSSVSSLRLGKYRNSYNAARIAQQHNPWRPELLWLEATSQLRLGDTDTAIDNYKKVLASYPNSPNTLNNLATSYNIKGDTAAALEVYRQLVDTQPSNMQLKFNYTMMLLRLGYGNHALPYVNETLKHYQSALAQQTARWMKQEQALHAAGQPIVKPATYTSLEKRVHNLQYWKQKIEAQQQTQQKSAAQGDEKAVADD